MILEKILEIESQIYYDLINRISEYLALIQKNAAILSRLDCLLSFASIAKNNNYVKPKINDSSDLKIKNGRHPVIEKLLNVGESYIPNNTFLDQKKQQIMMITGPNMSGKSALLRQTASVSYTHLTLPTSDLV